METIKILFFAAVPMGSRELMIGQEVQAITDKIDDAAYYDSIDLVPALAAKPDDLIKTLNKHKPRIVHFSAHGMPTGEILLLDPLGFSKPVSPSAIQALLKTLKDNIRIVILNACYSKLQAQAIVKVIDCVIGIGNAISNQAAILFAASFYRAVVSGRSVKEAYEQGRAKLMLEGIAEEHFPELLVKEGVDPAEVFFLDKNWGQVSTLDISTGSKESNGKKIPQLNYFKLLPKDTIINKESGEDYEAVLEEIKKWVNGGHIKKWLSYHPNIDDNVIKSMVKQAIFDAYHQGESDQEVNRIILLEAKGLVGKKFTGADLDHELETIMSIYSDSLLTVLESSESEELSFIIGKFLDRVNYPFVVISPHSPPMKSNLQWNRCHFRREGEIWIREKHHCDAYAGRFLWENSREENSREVFEEKISGFISRIDDLIDSVLLVNRIKGVDTFGEKFKRLFKHQIEDIRLVPDSGKILSVYNEHNDEPYYKYIELIVKHAALRPFFILGVAGGGKTALCFMLLKKIIAEKFINSSDENKILPIYIPFYTFKSIGDLQNREFFASIYRDLAPVAGEVSKMMTNGKVLMILDGLDEIDMDIVDKNYLDDVTIGKNPKKLEFIIKTLQKTYANCPLVITSRQYFFEAHSQNLETIGKEVLYIRPLNEEQKKKYIESRLEKSRAEKTFQLIRKFPDLFDLLPTVVLLEMLVTIMENSPSREIELFFKSKQIKRKDIYERLIEGWIDQHRLRLNEEKPENVDRYLMLVSLAMFHYGYHGGLIISDEKMDLYLKRFNIEKQKRSAILAKLRTIFSYSVSYKLNNDIIRKIGKEIDPGVPGELEKIKNTEYKNENDFLKAIEDRVGKEIVDRYRFDFLKHCRSFESDSQKKSRLMFSHKTILEYLVAKAVLKGIEGDPTILAQKPRTAVYNMLTGPLDKQDDEVIEFIRELVLFDKNDDKKLKKVSFRMLDIIEELDDDAVKNRFTSGECRHIRNNALKILAYINNRNLSGNRIPHPFNIELAYRKKFLQLFAYRDFSGIVLRNCNCANQNLEKARFENATLPSLGLAGCNLYGTSFKNSDLTAAYLGQSTAVWSLGIWENRLILDSGTGRLNRIDTRKGQRLTVLSEEEEIIWDLDVFCCNDKYFCAAGHRSSTITFLNLQTGENFSFSRNFQETIFCCRANLKKNIAAFAGSRGNIYILTHLDKLLKEDNPGEYLQDEANRKYHNLEVNLPGSFSRKHHFDTILSLTFSTCGNYLVSCGSDNKIKYWGVDYLLEEHKLSDRFIPMSIVDIEGEKQNRIRKIRSLSYNGNEYFAAGTQKGWLIVMEGRDQKLSTRAILKKPQKDWILDLEPFVYNGCTYLAAVSGDHTACIWDFEDICENQACAEVVFLSKYSNALLSVCTDKNSRGEAENIYFGSYDGNIIGKKLEELFRCQFDFNDDDEILPITWTRDDILIEINKQSESFVSDATNADFEGVTGLNEGRLFLLKQHGAICWSPGLDVSESIKENLIHFKRELNDLQKESRQFLVRQFSRTSQVKIGLSHYLREFPGLRQKLEKLITGINTFVSTIHDIRLKDEAINLYVMFTATKVVLASSLMILYWLSEETWRSNREVAVSPYLSCWTHLQQIAEPKKIRKKLPVKERFIYEYILEKVCYLLEEYFGSGDAGSSIFDIVYEDYRKNRQLQEVCDFLGGEVSTGHIPVSLPHLGVEFLWTELSNIYWSGNSRTAKMYFDSFPEKIYKCCGEINNFLVSRITVIIKELIEKEKDRRIRFLELASGFNGSIITNVYYGLSEQERNRVEFIASDSSPKVVDSLKEKFREKNTGIKVEIQNLADPAGFEASSFDIICQNLGGHHLPKEYRNRMYTKLIDLLTPGGYLAVGDVNLQAIKILAGLPDDIGAPESPYDCRKLDYKELKPLISGNFPEMAHDIGFYTCQIFQVIKGNVNVL